MTMDDMEEPSARQLPRRSMPLRQIQIPSAAQEGDVALLDHDKQAPFSHETFALRRKFPESLHFPSGALRMRSSTASTRSSISSAHVPDSATAYSPSTLASPLSSSYASDIQERFACHSLDPSKPAGRTRHGHRPSIATCSTFINDEEDTSISFGYHGSGNKVIVSQDRHGEYNDEAHELDIQKPGADSTPIKEEDDVSTPGQVDDWEHNSISCSSPCQKSEISFTKFGDSVSSDEVDGILDYTLQVAYGIEMSEVDAPADTLHHIVSKFVRDLGHCIWQAPLDNQVSQNTSISSSSNTPSAGQGGDGSNVFGKRKKQSPGESGGEDLSDGEGSGYNAVKRIKPSPRDDENLRLSCPYRKRNPHRFNVRDHHSCAMTYFPKFAELRQHIVKQHKRDDPSAFVCDRCTRDFRSRKELRDHQRQPKEAMCDISDHDPEAGIDGPTSNKLLSRKRVSGTSPEVQWREIWNILFPDDDDKLVRPFHFTPVIEHFELSAHYLEAFDYLISTLRDKISNPATLETLATKFHHCFIETVERCVVTSQSMPYANRSNKRSEPSRTTQSAQTRVRKPRVAVSRPDSGVVIDDTSEESGSITASSSLCHRDSVRTVTGYTPRRESHLAPKVNTDILPTPVTTGVAPNQDPMAPLPDFQFGASDMGVNMNHAAIAAVEEWTNNLSFNRGGLTGLSEQWMHGANMAPPVDFVDMDASFLYNAEFGNMNGPLTNMHGAKADGTMWDDATMDAGANT